MTDFQKVIKYCAMAFAIFLIVSIVGGIVGSISSLSRLFDGESPVGELQTYPVNEDVRELVIDIRGAELKIREGDRFSVESNLKKLSVESSGGCLSVIEKNRWGTSSYENALLVVTLPRDAELKEAELSTGAGKVTVEGLTAETLSMELGAGRVTMKNVAVTGEADIDGGAGQLEIEGGSLANLDLDMGVGELVLRSRLTGTCDLDMGVGQTTLTLIGTKEEYRVRLNKGLGNATFDGESMSDGSVYGSGAHSLNIDGGVGAIDLRFAAE
ncbi:MAG: DUF4097 family beta strand repeat protein [Clostridia bacterium]|nr:DUF4097 family beta strand repeat protein [Clostridia bacterium]